MKLTLILFLSLFSFCLAKAQLYVDAGPDTTYCYQIYPEVDMYLGEQVVIENAVEPITVAWECELDIGISKIFTASELLDDTTNLVALFTSYPTNMEYLKFILYVTDSEGNQAKDSINVRFSVFGYDLKEYHVYLNRGDAFWFDGAAYVGGGVQPLNIVWTPAYGLSDSTVLDAIASPDTSVSYYQVATDAAGCVSEPHLVYIIEVLPNGIKLNNSEDLLSQAGDKIISELNTEGEKEIKVYTVSGQQILTDSFTGGSYNLGAKLLKKGIYLCVIHINNEYYSMKFIK